MNEKIAQSNVYGRRMAFHLLLNTMDLVISTCKSAAFSCDAGRIEAHLHNAKRYYAAVLRHSGRLPMSAHDIHMLEFRGVQLENEISNLETKRTSFA